MCGPEDSFEVRDEAVCAAVDLLDELRSDDVEGRELARDGLVRALREVATPEEKAAVVAKLRRDQLDGEVARVFLGDALDTMDADAEAIATAVDDDTSDLVR